ncbi:hypothetical protein GCM10022280_24870 [Sphingomonas swuensis]|uniref:Rod shape-determining protein MreD n=1 Tax=Sphingomonas swuensis TaxID=977800 RepID=A0ABP7T9T0_9SPHN
MRIGLFNLLLLAVVALTWWRGRFDERAAGLICVAGNLATMLVAQSMATRFQSFDLLAFLVDLCVLGAFVALALRSERFWPMWVAGLQLTATSVHLLKLVSPDLMRFVFGAALAFWSYPIILLIAVGTLRTQLVEGWRARLLDPA